MFMPLLANTHNCTACAACLNTCAHHAISLFPDKEGFLQPSVDQVKCVECGMCEIKCPALNPLELNAKGQIAYAIINDEDRKVSSSGGAFSLFARYVLNKGGVVYGSTMDDDFQVYHTRIDSIEGLGKLRGSKYVQSNIKKTFQEAKKDLKSGLIVLYTGTPCQISGLYNYLGQRYENLLITLDIVCHGVPNQEIFNKYLHKLKKSTHLSTGIMNIEEFRFRNLNSWSIVPAVKISKSKWKILEQEENVYMNAFFKLSIFRESCYHCQYSNMNRVGTFTIADYWGIGKEGLKFKKDVSSGVSLVIDNQGKMSELMEEICKYAYIEERPLDEGRKHNHNLNSPSNRPSERDTAVIDLLDENISLIEYAQKYHLLDGKLKHFIKHTLKELIYSLGLYNVYKTISYKFGQGV